jgi:tetratricopeptide (TPR) repeat protein
MRYIFFLFLLCSLALNAQISAERHKAMADSIQKIIEKQTNDTAVVFYELERDNHVFFDHPERSLKMVRPLYALARKSGHKNSIARTYFMWGRALWRMAEMENDVVKKEKLLARADSLADKQFAFALNELSGEERIVEADRAMGLYGAISDRSVKKKEYYFKKRVDGYHILLDKYELRKYPKKFMGITFGLAVIHQSFLKTQQAVKYYLMVAEYADSIKEYDRASEYYNNLGFTFFADGNLAWAQRYYFLSLKCSEKLPPDSFTVTELHKDRITNVGITLSNIANVFYLQKNNSQAIEFYKKALPYYLDGGAHENYMAVIVRIGNIYAGMNQLDSAESYLRKEKKLTYLLKDKNQLLIHEMRSNGLKGYILAQKKQYREAIIVAQNVVRLAEQIGNAQGKIVAYESLGNYYVQSGQGEKGIECYNKQLTITDRKSGWAEKFLSKIYINKGKAFMKMNRSDSAIANLLMAKELAEKKNIKLEMNSVYQTLSEAYIQASDMPNAVVYLKKHIQYKDSLMGDQVTQQVTSMGLKYESDLKLMQEKAIREKQRLENEKKTEEQAQQRRTLIVIILSVSFLVIIAIYSLIRIKRSNILLEAQKKEIEDQKNLVTHQKHIVEEKNKEITDSIQYAKRIQSALIQTQPHFEGNFKDHFIFLNQKTS